MRDQVVPVFYDEKSFTSPQYATTIQGIRSAAGKCGMRIKLFPDTHFDGIDFSQLPPISIVTGISMPFIQKAIARLRENGRFAVLAGTDSEQFGHDVSCATPSRRTETQQLVNYLYNCGKRRLALVGFGQHSINDNFRYHAAMSAVAAWGLFLREKDVWLWEHDPMESFAKFVPVADQYDSVICPNDMVAVYFIEYLRQKDREGPPPAANGPPGGPAAEQPPGVQERARHRLPDEPCELPGGAAGVRFPYQPRGGGPPAGRGLSKEAGGSDGSGVADTYFVTDLCRSFLLPADNSVFSLDFFTVS